MRSLATLIGLLLMAATSANAAQLYRWVDAKGNVEWRDTPPSTAVPAKNIEQRRVSGGAAEGGDVPFSLQLAMKNHPVTFWVSDCGAACTAARAHLNRRGTPFTEKAAQTEFEAFKKVSPSAEVPVLQVGIITLKGYAESEWDSTLDNAGYPRTAVAQRAKPAATPPAGKPAADGTKPPADNAATPPARGAAPPPTAATPLR